jgi:hypothetical protein
VVLLLLGGVKRLQAAKDQRCQIVRTHTATLSSKDLHVQVGEHHHFYGDSSFFYGNV